MSVVAFVRQHVRRVIAFGITSLAGLAIDFLAFAFLLASGVSVVSASRLSSALAVTFVYFASVRRTFVYEGRFVFGLFAVYAAYQALGIFLAAAGVAGLVNFGVAPLLAKMLILPLTFPANYLAMSLITSRRAERRT